ncbi:NAD(P)H-dependent oxidoreductase [Mesorhizobium jarvisii]|uniref:NAD(P)H-dependent oxidoreductase n=1 Tax=Rhizobium loti TaxID=381 RepID=UPI001CB77B67
MLLAHPEKNSLNAHLARSAKEKFESNGTTVELVDLYREHSIRLNEALTTPNV